MLIYLSFNIFSTDITVLNDMDTVKVKLFKENVFHVY